MRIALRRMVEIGFDYHADNREFVRLVMDENIRRGVQIETRLRCTTAIDRSCRASTRP